MFLFSASWEDKITFALVFWTCKWRSSDINENLDINVFKTRTNKKFNFLFFKRPWKHWNNKMKKKNKHKKY